MPSRLTILARVLAVLSASDASLATSLSANDRNRFASIPNMTWSLDHLAILRGGTLTRFQRHSQPFQYHQPHALHDRFVMGDENADNSNPRSQDFDDECDYFDNEDGDDDDDDNKISDSNNERVDDALDDLDMAHCFNKDDLENESLKPNRVPLKLQLTVRFLEERDETIEELMVMIHVAMANAMTILLEEQTPYHCVLREDQLYHYHPSENASAIDANDPRTRRITQMERFLSDDSDDSSTEEMMKEEGTEHDRHDTDNVAQDEEKGSEVSDADVRNVDAATTTTPAVNDVDDALADPLYGRNPPWESRVQLLHRWTWVTPVVPRRRQTRRLIRRRSRTGKTSRQLPQEITMEFNSKVLYHAVWKDTRLPIVSENIMDQVTFECQDTLLRAMEDGSFVILLQEVLEVVHDEIENYQNKENNNNGATLEPTEDYQERPLPPELDDSSSTSITTPTTTTASSSLGLDIVGVTPSDGYGLPPGESMTSMNGDEGESSKHGGGHGTFDHNLHLTAWGIREWLGLATASFVVVVGSLLTLVASVLGRRQEQKRKWASMLTEEGVNELLQVGWRYHHGQLDNAVVVDENHSRSNNNDASSPPGSSGQQQQQQQQQLYLQIYDRRQSRYYNDNDSLLKGGVEQEWIQQQHEEIPAIGPVATGTATDDEEEEDKAVAERMPPKEMLRAVSMP